MRYLCAVPPVGARPFTHHDSPVKIFLLFPPPAAEAEAGGSVPPAEGNKAPAPALTINGAVQPAPYVTLPDTALLTRERPFFVPDFARPCSARPVVVARVARLGKTIGARWARRYVDAVSLGVSFRAEALWRVLRAAGQPWEAAVAFDGALSVGTFVPLTEALGQGQSAEFRLGAAPPVAVDVRAVGERIDSAVAFLSRIYTLRQGDLIAFAAAPLATDVALDTHITARLGDAALLSFNVK